MAGISGATRCVEDVEKLIEKAKLDLNDLSKYSQSLKCGDNFGIDDRSIILLELNDSLKDKLNKGDKIIIRGEKDESAVLCTQNETYDLKEAETSNSLLILHEFSIPDKVKDKSLTSRIVVERKVSSILHLYYEVKKCKPRIGKLRRVLEENPYHGPEYEGENVGSKYTFEDLLNIIQASEEELTVALDRLPAFYINGHWRCLDSEYQCRIINYIFNVIESNSISINNIPIKAVIDMLDELAPREILERCLNIYTEPLSNDKDIYRLKEDKVCQFFAEVLLRSSGKFHLQEFLESWQKSVPEGLQTRLLQLEGLALTDRSSKPETVIYYPVWGLPEQINERFDILFQQRTKWAYDDIRPYIEDLTTEGLNVNALLTKYARASVLNGVKMYNSKHPIK